MDPAAIITTLTNSAALRADIASETYHITCETDTATSIHIDLSSQSITSTDDDKQTTVSTPNATVFCFAIVFRLAPLWRQAEGLKTIRGMRTFSNLETEWTMRRETLEAPPLHLPERQRSIARFLDDKPKHGRRHHESQLTRSQRSPHRLHAAQTITPLRADVRTPPST